MCPRVIVPAGSGLAKATSCHGFFYYISHSPPFLPPFLTCISSSSSLPSRLKNEGRRFANCMFINLTYVSRGAVSERKNNSSNDKQDCFINLSSRVKE